MIWVTCFSISSCILIVSVLTSMLSCSSRVKSSRTVSGFKILLTGTCAASVAMFYPIYYGMFEGSAAQILKTVLLSVHNTIRLFVIDGEFDIINDSVSSMPAQVGQAYPILASVIYVLAPILTFSFIISIFNDLSAHFNFAVHFNSDICVFSELNEKAADLALSIYDSDDRSLFVFTDVFSSGKERDYELLEKIKRIRPVNIKDDITVLRIKFHSKKSRISFFVIGEDEEENTKQAVELIEKYRERPGVSLYVFSNSAESELVLNSMEKGNMKVRRIDEVQSLIYRMLYESGGEIFKSALDGDGGEKWISVLIAGLGKYGTEMLRDLVWFCQMDGYRVTMDAFEKDEKAESKFRAVCPELMDPRFNGIETPGEARYRISIHSGIDVSTAEFEDEIKKAPDYSFAFVALGSDETDISMAVSIRAMFERLHKKPVICAVVADPGKKKALLGIRNHKDQPYDIKFIGDVETSYRREVVIDSDLEDAAFHRHERSKNQEKRWQQEYFYRSSLASAIHRKMKIECGMPGADKPPDRRSEEEKRGLRLLEHRRWNAYMRSAGYSYAPVRNDLAKQHNCLVPFDDLPESEKEKDDY